MPSLREPLKVASITLKSESVYGLISATSGEPVFLFVKVKEVVSNSIGTTKILTSPKEGVNG